MGRRVVVIGVLVTYVAALGAGVASASTPWAIGTTPNPAGATSSQLSGASCSSASACTAVGSTVVSGTVQTTLAERWNGTSWTIQSTPNPAGAINSYLNGVSCPSANSCTAVGVTENSARVEKTLAERWNGTSWTIESTPNPAGASVSQLSAVSCPTAKTCTATGNTINGADLITTLAERWNGSSWTRQSTPNPAGATVSDLFGVSCISTEACTAVGNYVNSIDVDVTLAESWNGSSWAIHTTPNHTGSAASELYGVSCAAAADCVAVGAWVNGSGTEFTTAEKWNGTSWSQQTTHQPASALQSILQGVSCTSATACTAVGFSGNGATASTTLVESWNGTTWATSSSPNPSGATWSALDGVSCLAVGTCRAAGYYVQAATISRTLAESD